MARINWEDEIYADKRWQWLIAYTGNPTIAKGAIMEAFILAQKYFSDEKTEGLIPLIEWDQQDMHPALLESKCAVIMDKGVYVMGSQKHFNWLKQKSESGSVGGVKSAQRRAEAKASKALADAENTTDPSESNQTQADPSKSNPPTLPPSLTHSQEEYIPPTPLGELPVKIDDVVQLFNDTLAGKAGKIRFCKGLTRDDELAFIETVIRPAFSNLEAWRSLFEDVGKNSFLRGMGKDSTWAVTLGWLLQYDNAIEVVNGAYPPSEDYTPSINSKKSIAEVVSEIRKLVRTYGAHENAKALQTASEAAKKVFEKVGGITAVRNSTDFELERMLVGAMKDAS